MFVFQDDAETWALFPSLVTASRKLRGGNDDAEIGEPEATTAIGGSSAVAAPANRATRPPAAPPPV